MDLPISISDELLKTIPHECVWSLNGYIYLLKDPETKEVRYIGKSGHVANSKMPAKPGDPLIRYLNHVRSRQSSHVMTKWLIQIDFKPLMEIVDLAPLATIDDVELAWICKYHLLVGSQLLNVIIPSSFQILRSQAYFNNKTKVYTVKKSLRELLYPSGPLEGINTQSDIISYIS